MKIITQLCPNNEYYAIDEDSYDGAADGNRLQGWGKTELEAVRDLIDQLDDVFYEREAYLKTQALLNNIGEQNGK